MALDEDGIGDIWLAEQGIDWPADANAMRFRSNLTTRAKSVSNSRKNRARYVLKRVSTPDGEKVRKVLDFQPLRVKVRLVSEHQVAFQFYNGTEPPADPEAISVHVPTTGTHTKPPH